MVYRIRTSIKPTANAGKECACEHISDVTIHFPDGSLKRPDISIFCEPPPMQDEALTVVLDAVIEVINPGYEYKDVELNPKFYLSHGLEDVIIVDPRSGVVAHYRKAGMDKYVAPVMIELECGCQCTVPQGETGQG